jgi:hypothetical protein
MESDKTRQYRNSRIQNWSKFVDGPLPKRNILRGGMHAEGF